MSPSNHSCELHFNWSQFCSCIFAVIISVNPTRAQNIGCLTYAKKINDVNVAVEVDIDFKGGFRARQAVGAVRIDHRCNIAIKVDVDVKGELQARHWC